MKNEFLYNLKCIEKLTKELFRIGNDEQKNQYKSEINAILKWVRFMKKHEELKEETKKLKKQEREGFDYE